MLSPSTKQQKFVSLEKEAVVTDSKYVKYHLQVWAPMIEILFCNKVHSAHLSPVAICVRQYV